MTEHVHRWKIRTADDLERVGEVIAESFSEDGKWLKTIFADEIEHRLNATERLSKSKADTAASLIRGHTVKDDLKAYVRELEVKDEA